MPTFNILHLVRDYLWPANSDPATTTTMFSQTRIVGTASKPAINFLRGWPNNALLPVDLLKEAANHAFSDTSIAFPGLQYGPDAGNESFREAVAAWLTSFYDPHSPISPARICINGGASQSLAVLLNVYSDPEYTRNVWFVAPAYMLVFRIFEDAGFAGKMCAVPEDEEGIDISFLREEIRKSEEAAERQGNTAPRYKPDRERAKVYKHVIYCVPTFSNPSSRTMTQQRRLQLVQLAREFDALVTCDDVYDFLQFPADGSSKTVEAMESSHVSRLVDIDRTHDGGTDRDGADGFGNVVSNGTFSKLAGPGLRCGWIEGSAKLAWGVSQAGAQRSGGAPSQLTSTYLTRLLETGQLQSHITKVLRPAYTSRYRAMAKAVKEHLLPLGFEMPQPNRDVVGGYFVWLGLPAGLKAAELTQKCQDEEALVIAPGSIFEVPGDNVKFQASVRICFAYEEEAKLSEGVRRIGAAAKRLLEKGDDARSDYVLVEKDAAENSKFQGFM